MKFGKTDFNFRIEIRFNTFDKWNSNLFIVCVIFVKEITKNYQMSRKINSHICYLTLNI